MELKGIIKVINLNTGNEKYAKSEIVLTTDADKQYPQNVLIEFGGDSRCDLPKPYKVGEEVTISININGREWTNAEWVVKYFNSIQGWKIKRDKKEAAPQVEDDEAF